MITVSVGVAVVSLGGAGDVILAPSSVSFDPVAGKAMGTPDS